MRRPRRAMHLLLRSGLAFVAFLAGSAAVAGSSGVAPAVPCRTLFALPATYLSVMRLPLQATMHHDSDTVKINPGQRTFLEPNFPNPFNVATTIAYSLAEPTRVELRVYDFDFVEVALLVDEDQQPGRYRVLFDPNLLPLRAASGMYFYELKTNRGVELKRMLYIK